MKMFFFGTLMDKRVVERVTGLSNPLLVPAFIKGFERRYAKGASFPVLIPSDHQNMVDGVVFETDNEEVINRIDRYESGLYYSEFHTIYYMGDGKDEARVYMADWNKLSPSNEVWTYKEWKNG